MKKYLIITLLFFVSCGNCFASCGYKYTDGGGIYTGVTFPKAVSNTTEKKDIDLTNLKRGESVSRNILYLVDIGDSGIHQAAKNGNITKIYYVDTKYNKLLIPLGFIIIYVKETKTIVYGE